ncbi:hypothetical protein BOX15_Mlig002939g1 [Macrostomum lignano]|uniref:WSC domain-containing protein n=1 Tax=Macrostomum lignano TaxID=282301 RepID=A0A267FG12_9PLAT|nr:hypothetical protein BOX15_Mlig002939g2 [Macrostomum lignano]PAA72087.1 hypothetical protein BOX15_Mlig002939g1 [Macrostomum lignano]
MLNFQFIACLVVLLTTVASVQACPRSFVAIRNTFSSRIKTLNGPSCFTERSLRTAGETEGTYDELKETMTPDACRKLCKDKGHSASKIIAVSQTLCHCDKNFKKEGLSDVAKCTNSCPGNLDERCGGPEYLSAYPV